MSFLEVLIIIAIYPLFSFVIAYFLGKKRQIGFKWSLFFSLTLLPVSGLIITMLSRKHPKNSKTKSSTKRILGQVILLIAAISFFAFVYTFEFGKSAFSALIPLSGIIGLGLYLIDLGDINNDDSETYNLNL